MAYELTIVGAAVMKLSAPTAAEAVRKAKVLEATGRRVTIRDPEGEPVNLQMLELAVRGNRFGDDG